MNFDAFADQGPTARVPNLPEDGLVVVLQSPGFWVYVVVALAYLTFIYRYMRYSPWRADSVGKGLMTMALSGGAIMLNALTAILLGPEFPGREVIRLVLLGGAGVSMFYMVKNLVELQGGWRQKHLPKRKRLRDRSESPPPPRPNVE